MNNEGFFFLAKNAGSEAFNKNAFVFEKREIVHEKRFGDYVHEKEEVLGW
jgi:hypothetical protein